MEIRDRDKWDEGKKEYCCRNECQQKIECYGRGSGDEHSFPESFYYKIYYMAYRYTFKSGEVKVFQLAFAVIIAVPVFQMHRLNRF